MSKCPTKATAWLSFVEQALFQHHGCIPSGWYLAPRGAKYRPLIDESNLHLICISLKFFHTSIMKRSIALVAIPPDRLIACCDVRRPYTATLKIAIYRSLFECGVGALYFSILLLHLYDPSPLLFLCLWYYLLHGLECHT